MKKELREMNLNRGTNDQHTDAPESTAIRDSLSQMQYFNDMIQDLLNSKIGKAESYLIGAYLNE